MAPSYMNTVKGVFAFLLIMVSNFIFQISMSNPDHPTSLSTIAIIIIVLCIIRLIIGKWPTGR